MVYAAPGVSPGAACFLATWIAIAYTFKGGEFFMFLKKAGRSPILFLATLMFALLCATGPVRADVSVAKEFEGTLVVTFPDGEIELLEAGDNIPAIPSQAVLEIFDGSFSVVTGDKDSIDVACLDHTGSAGAGTSLTLSCLETSGLLKVAAGNVSLRTPDGKIVQLGAGDEYAIQLPGLPQAAPATAAGEDNQVARGIAGEDTNPPVDPRGIDPSPAG
jgi:hypothetical protein